MGELQDIGQSEYKGKELDGAKLRSELPQTYGIDSSSRDSIRGDGQELGKAEGRRRDCT